LRKALVMFSACLSIAASAMAHHDKKPVDPNKKVCRPDTAIGSIMPKMTCHTAAEWAAIDGDNARAASQMLNQGPGGGKAGSH
jgi:hypothetical protein